MVRKLNTETEGDLDFFRLLKGNSFQNVTFFARIHKKLWKNIFLPTSQICIFYVIKSDQDGLTS